VPGVVYSGGEEARPFQVGERDLRAILLSGHALFDLEIDGGGKAVPVVIKEQQLHPVRGNVEHIDLQQVRLDEKIQAEVAIELSGAEEAPGSKEGGVLEHITREITVEALPTDIPEQIVVDVSMMEVNDTIQLSSLAAPEGAEFVADDPEEVTIATLTPPRLEKELEEIEEEAALVGEGEEGEEGAEEGEEVPEGEEAPEGEGEEAAEGGEPAEGSEE
jgi:large subunit ribosomal protein L25